MTPPRFLADECFHRDIVDMLRMWEPTIDILAVGEPGAPPKGTLDPDILVAAEAMKRIVLSGDKKTMPDHLRDHCLAGRHIWGMLLLLPGYADSRYARDIQMIWGATDADEWFDRLDFLPF